MLKPNKERKPCTKAELMPKLDEAKRTIDEAVAKTHVPGVIAFSGGKDSLPLAHMLGAWGVRAAVCETSFFFTEQTRDVHRSIKELDLDCKVSRRLELPFLAANQELVMARDPKLRAKMFAANHWATMNDFIAERGAKLVFLGRRTQENTVPGLLYEKAGVWQCCPMRNWRTEHVWGYIEHFGIRVPYIYGTPFNAGQAPWTSCSWENHIDEAWTIVEAIEPAVVTAAANAQIKSARDYLARKESR